MNTRGYEGRECPQCGGGEDAFERFCVGRAVVPFQRVGDRQHGDYHDGAVDPVAYRSGECLELQVSSVPARSSAIAFRPECAVCLDLCCVTGGTSLCLGGPTRRGAPSPNVGVSFARNPGDQAPERLRRIVSSLPLDFFGEW